MENKTSKEYEDVKFEAIQLQQRITNLNTFIESEKFNNLQDEHKNLLIMQLNAMMLYFNILNMRLCKWDMITDNMKHKIDVVKSNIVI